MKNVLFQIAVFTAAVLAAGAQAPVMPPILDVDYILNRSRADAGCPHCNRKKNPVVEESLSKDYSTKLPDCDRVEVFLLEEDIKHGSAADRFPIRPDEGSSEIMERKELIGAEAAKLCSLWRVLTFDNGFPGYAPVYTHSPVYGLRFHLADKIVFETCVNFKHHNFYYPRTVFPMKPGAYSWHGFRTGDEAGKALIAFLNETLPRKAAGE